MIDQLNGLSFAAAFLGCVLATPVVTWLAARLGAIDRPDRFRRLHSRCTPRLGGLAVAFGLILGLAVGLKGPSLEGQALWVSGWPQLMAIALASLLMLGIGAVDDTRGPRGLGARSKLIGQVVAVLILDLGGIRIERVELFGFFVELSEPAWTWQIGPWSWSLAPLSLGLTTFWFLGSMNAWNLIDGMDGLASGVGLLVAGTLMLVALHLNNAEAALLAATLVGSLAGFLLYNWHPACIFLGDSGSLLIGLWLGLIGVQSATTGAGSSSMAILLPILAMGLPISDSAMAIFRRWVRHLPMSATERRHVHHLLMGLGLNPRQAALFLYSFAGFLCGTVLLGVTFENESLAAVMGISGVLAFLLILTSRRDELSQLLHDLAERFRRDGQQRRGSRVAWEAIQRIEICPSSEGVLQIFGTTTASLSCRILSGDVVHAGESMDWPIPESEDESQAETDRTGSNGIQVGLCRTSPRMSFQVSGTSPKPESQTCLTIAMEHDPSTLPRQTDGPSVGRLEPDVALRFVLLVAKASVARLEALAAQVDPLEIRVGEAPEAARQQTDPSPSTSLEADLVGSAQIPRATTGLLKLIQRLRPAKLS